MLEILVCPVTQGPKLCGRSAPYQPHESSSKKSSRAIQIPTPVKESCSQGSGAQCYGGNSGQLNNGLAKCSGGFSFIRWCLTLSGVLWKWPVTLKTVKLSKKCTFVIFYLQVSETPGVWNTAFKYSRTVEPSLTKCCQDAAMKTWAGFGKEKKISILNFLVLKRISLSSQAAVLGWWGLNQKLQLAMALPNLASRPSSMDSVIKQCCLTVQDLDLLPTLVDVNNSQKLLFDTARQSHCPSSYTRDGVPCAAPQALASAVHPWYSGLNPGCTDFLSWVLCAVITPLEECFYVERCISAGKLLSSLWDVCWSESCCTKPASVVARWFGKQWFAVKNRSWLRMRNPKCLECSGGPRPKDKVGDLGLA